MGLGVSGFLSASHHCGRLQFRAYRELLLVGVWQSASPACNGVKFSRIRVGAFAEAGVFLE